MIKLSNEDIANRVFENSLETCEYISGYKDDKSIIRVKCLIHNFEFETKWYNVSRCGRKHHICPICKQEDLKNKSSKIECECAYCHKIFWRTPSKIEKSRSGLLFCCREHKDLAQRLESGTDFIQMRPPHYGVFNGEGYGYRKKAFKEYPHKCAICGWDEDEDILEVHHIDSDRTNNQLSNLIILCPTCHRKLTLHKYILLDRTTIQKLPG